ncbi:sex comb on midleg-like protein 4 isoform X3 [Takifugu rubripes]|nr:sex comb on midleg-like protein 4 isoform X3 [Takifugu rubripes]XP_029685652.1 sex comb on midleg-like protein 4 isoform X3 [Takifugu rubripes]XP_056914630.1 sex comb on midleg-like protein 4 isoform X2 [Takifugu flavidus]XP_056914631.1 sex comb on midleg-like protein 4 isoform X2 [Takifugu flavidus]XP_056914632.1 sex comb on midleg-like protein 4 isoform X2 [Takifugu flavidus]
MSVPEATAQKSDSNNGEMQSAAVAPSFIPSQSGKIPGRKRGRPPLRNVAKLDFTSRYPDTLPPLKVPKKRGRKPGFKLKPRMVMTPLAISPPSSTPEPDMSSIPQDAATIPHSATPQVLTVCIYINKQANTGPNLDRKKIQQLPDHFGPDRPSVVLQQAVQGCIDSAFQQKTVFTLLTQGYGGEKISGVVQRRRSATFDGKQHLLSLPVVNSIDYVLRFLKKLCRSLHCENLFSDEPITQHNSGSYQSDAETSMTEDYHLDQSDGKRYSVDPGDSAFGSISSSYSTKSYSFRSTQQFSNGPASMSMCRQSSTSPNSFPESNRTGYNAPSESQESKAPVNKDPTTWSVDDVVWFIRDADPQALGPHADIFRKHEIDGNALLLLKSDMIMKYLGLKLGPALKLCYHIDKLKQNKF